MSASADVITVCLHQRWTQKCKSCGTPVTWRRRPAGRLEVFEADPTPLRTYFDDTHGCIVQDLNASALHGDRCGAVPMPLLDQVDV